MDHPSSFVDVRHVFVEHSARPGWLQSLVGHHATTHSVLRNVSFQINQGDWVTVYGAEGAGKSTLLRLLVGILTPSSGKVFVNGKNPAATTGGAAGYVSSEESETDESVYTILSTFGRTHQLPNLPARLGELAEILGIQAFLHRSARGLSTAQRLRVNLAKAALADTPLILLDGTADELGAETVRVLCDALFSGRTIIFTTRFADTADTLRLPILLLHQGSLLHTGTCDEIASTVGCPRILEAWIEGLRYDLLRTLRAHAGVETVQLLPSSRFAGQKLRIRLKNARYLPAIYDVLSQAPLVRVNEVPASLTDILSRL